MYFVVNVHSIFCVSCMSEKGDQGLRAEETDASIAPAAHRIKDAFQNFLLVCFLGLVTQFLHLFTLVTFSMFYCTGRPSDILLQKKEEK